MASGSARRTWSFPGFSSCPHRGDSGHWLRLAGATAGLQALTKPLVKRLAASKDPFGKEMWQLMRRSLFCTGAGAESTSSSDSDDEDGPAEDNVPPRKKSRRERRAILKQHRKRDGPTFADFEGSPTEPRTVPASQPVEAVAPAREPAPGTEEAPGTGLQQATGDVGTGQQAKKTGPGPTKRQPRSTAPAKRGRDPANAEKPARPAS